MGKNNCRQGAILIDARHRVLSATELCIPGHIGSVVNHQNLQLVSVIG